MKTNIYYIILIGLFFVKLTYSQCNLGNTYNYTFNSNTLNTGTRTQMICCLWGNEYMSISNIVAGNTYTFDSCGANNNTTLTLFDPNNNTVAFNNNGCSGGGGLITSFTAPVSGTYKIQVNTSSCSAVNINTPVSITLETVLGVKDFNLAQSVLLYPNPTSNSFSVTTEVNIQTLTLTNMLGKKVKTFTQQQDVYNIENLANGIYTVNIETKKGNVSKKIVKK